MEVVATFASAATKLLLRSPISIARALQCELISERCMMIASCLCHANVHCCRTLSYSPPRHYLHLVTFRVRDCLRNAENDPSIIINYNRIMINKEQQMYNFMLFWYKPNSACGFMVWRSLSQYMTRLFKFCFLLFEATWIVSNHYPLVKSESWV